MCAEIPAFSRQCHVALLGSVLHESVMSDLVGEAVVVTCKAAHDPLMLEPLFRRHELPAGRVRPVRMPRSSREGGSEESERKRRDHDSDGSVRHLRARFFMTSSIIPEEKRAALTGINRASLLTLLISNDFSKHAKS